MDYKPIFLFAFANDRSKTLRLEEEERQVRNILEAHHMVTGLYIMGQYQELYQCQVRLVHLQSVV